jgi:DNA-binding NarL/FixJ family response regulator
MSAGTPARVLVVDDHAMFAQSLTLALELEDDLEVVGVATSLAAARSRVLDSHPDVVVLDQRMPDGSGVHAVPELRALRPSIRIVILTAQAGDAVVSAALQAKVDGFVLKSDSIGNLIGAVRAAAVGHSVVSPAVLSRLLPRFGGSASSAEELTGRERDVLTLLAEGLTNKAIATRLQLSPHTVRNHLARICAKMNAHSKLELLSIAAREGLVG